MRTIDAKNIYADFSEGNAPSILEGDILFFH